MSFLRPEVTRLFARWAETAAYVAVTTLGVAWLWSAVETPGWRWGLIAVAAVAGFWLSRAAALSALAARDDTGPGMVLIDERRIAYFGPDEGGVASINDIYAIEIVAPDPSIWRYTHEWILRWSKDEAALVIPATATGAEGLTDAFAALPGFEPARAIAALNAEDGAFAEIWRRDPAPPGLALARPGD